MAVASVPQQPPAAPPSLPAIQFPENAVVDLHDLCAIFMHERLKLEMRFRGFRLSHYLRGPVGGAQAAKWDVQPEEYTQGRGRVSIIVKKDGTESKELVTPENFVRNDAQLPRELAGGLPYELREALLWRALNFDCGYALVFAMQTILDALPPSTLLRIRTANPAHNGNLRGPQMFGIMELPVQARELTYVASVAPGEANSGKLIVNEYVTGGEGGVLPWIFLLLGPPLAQDTPLAADTRIVLDLAITQLGGSGPAGELFALERVGAYFSGTLARVAQDVGGELRFSRRTEHVREDRAGLVHLANAVLNRLARVLALQERFCAHCGAPGPQHCCTACNKACFCSVEHQYAGWPFHKHYCAPTVDT